MPSWAVTTVVITFGPTLNGKAADAEPDAVATPFTAAVALGSAVVGVTALTQWRLIRLRISGRNGENTRRQGT